MELDYRSGFYHKGLYTGSVTIVTSDYTKRAQHWINDSEYDRFLHIYNIYIMCKITRAQALFQYLIWSYHISSRRHEDCILFDHFELWHASQQQCCSTALSPPDSLRRVSNFQVKRQSRIFETSSHGIWNLQQLTRKHVRVCRCLCCYASGSLKWR